MLPRAAYVDPAVLAWEQANFFAGWTCLGRADDLNEPGMQRAYAAGAESVLVIRGDDRALRGFANVCRHRGHELLPCGGSATKKAIVCPYHAWTYALDGSLRGAPGFRNSPGFEPSGLGLAELPLVDWHGWIFVDSSNQAGPFGEHVGSLEEIVAPYSPETLRVATSHSYEVAANWKVIIENYQECYHCSNIHPELCRVSPPDSGENIDVRRRLGRRLDGPARGRGDDVLRRREPRDDDHRPERARAAHGDVRRRVPQPADQPAPGLRHDAHDATHSTSDARSSSAPGCSRQKPLPRLGSTRRTPSTSGTSPTVRTGRRASPCSAA